MLDQGIFISYGTGDAQAHAGWLHDALKKNGFKTRFAQGDIAPGSVWDSEIDRGLSSATALVVVLTPGSVASAQVKGEWNYALNHYLPVIPLIFIDCNIPRRLSILNFLDFQFDRDQMLKKLVVRIRDLDEKYPQELKRQLDAFQDARKTAPDPDRYNGKTTGTGLHA